MVFALCSLVLAQQMPYGSLPAYKAYETKVVNASRLSVEWNETMKGDDKIRRFKLRCSKPDSVSLEETGVRRTIWNGAQGIELDLVAKKFTKLTKKPDFAKAQFLGLPLIGGLPAKDKWSYGEQRVQDSNRSKWNVIHSSLTAHIEEGMPVEWSATSEFWFSQKTSLMAMMVFEAFGRRVKTVTTFDIDPVLAKSEFDVAPPSGFVEAKQTGSGLNGGQGYFDGFIHPVREPLGATDRGPGPQAKDSLEVTLAYLGSDRFRISFANETTKTWLVFRFPWAWEVSLRDKAGVFISSEAEWRETINILVPTRIDWIALEPGDRFSFVRRAYDKNGPVAIGKRELTVTLTYRGQLGCEVPTDLNRSRGLVLNAIPKTKIQIGGHKGSQPPMVEKTELTK